MNILLLGAGYIGTAVAQHLALRNHSLTVVDLGWFHKSPSAICADFDVLARDVFDAAECVLLFAGHSSVSMCRREPHASLENNVGAFMRLLPKLSRQRFVYASSVSVYVQCFRNDAMEHDPLPTPANAYDMHKQCIDRIASGCDTAIGLRFGTVCGYSPVWRHDLLLNKMWADATACGVVTSVNPHIHRPILGMQDLCAAVEHIVEKPAFPSGIFNLASFNATVGELARTVATRYGARVEERTMPGNCYDIRASVTRLQQTEFTCRSTVESILDELDRRLPQNGADRS